MMPLRVLSETLIVLTWMSKAAPGIYERYQNYGRGKAKLLQRHLESVAATFPEGPPEYVERALQHFEKKLGGEWGQEFQEVSLDTTFSGRSVRDMAREAGLEDEYRYMYQSASGAAHGEWWAIEDYSMQRCLNPLHRFHLIPSFDPEFPTTSDFAGLLVRKLGDLIDLALRQLFPTRRPEP